MISRPHVCILKSPLIDQLSRIMLSLHRLTREYRDAGRVTQGVGDGAHFEVVDREHLWVRDLAAMPVLVAGAEVKNLCNVTVMNQSTIDSYRRRTRSTMKYVSMQDSKKNMGSAKQGSRSKQARSGTTTAT